MAFEPIRIDFAICGLVGRSHHPIHLDALIAQRMIKAECGLAPSQDDADRILAALPLERRDFGGEWVWTASSIAFDWSGPATQVAGVRAFRPANIAKHLDIIAKSKDYHGIHTGKGPWKSEQYSNPLQQARAARAYAIGDRERISQLLEGLDAIGTQRRHNNANVRSVTVTRDETAFDLWKRRYLPLGAEVKAPCREGAFKLPMFERSHQTIVKDNHLEYS